ncbi:MAG TPA: prepilin-type N-terminal cleavage/methylation domain-containing protein [Candidatus Ozemobacteraceae bacterium]|nr:prepilin-type N-terminal cleavage/methylation domain-containing protein [Candidatus Ozemobacteraceae bacterium]
MKNWRGFTFMEILVAVTVFASVSGALLGLMRETTADTGKAIYYLRALELGQETIDWMVSAPLDAARRKALEGMGGSIVDAGSGKGAAIPVGSSRDWPVALRELTYPDAYGQAYFYRTLQIEPVSGRPNLFEVNVEISWNEGAPPAVIESPGGNPDRMRKIVLSTLVYDETPSP